MEALKVYQDMTSPSPTHHLHAPPSGTKRVSKSAAKRQRAKQRQEADEAAAVATMVRASRAAATPVESQPARDSASQIEQVEFDSNNDQADARNQTADLPAQNGNTFQTGACLPDHTAEHVAEESVDGGLSQPYASDISTAREGSQSPNKAAAHKSSPATPPRGLASQPWTDPVTPSKQATASDPTNGHTNGLQTTTATPVPSSSGASSSDGPAHMSAVDILLLKPDRQQPSQPADETHASSASADTSDVSHRNGSAELRQPSDPPQSSAPYPFGSPQQQQDRSPGGDSGAGLGSSGDKGGGPSGTQAEAVLVKRPVAPASSSDSSRGHARLVGSLKLSQRAICFPSIGATAALVHAFAIVDDIPECFR